MSLGDFLTAAALGLVKGLVSREKSEGFQVDHHVIGPIREEVQYRGHLGDAPAGSTAASFAADHLAHDMKTGPQMTPMQVAARLGDVFLGGLLYERSRKTSGLLGAITSHSAHNVFLSLGQHLRNGKKRK